MKLKDCLNTSICIEAEEIGYLPVFHTTLYENALSIFENGLEPTHCDVFGEDLLYLFYGRSSYSKDNLERRDMIDEDDIKLAISFGFDLRSLQDDLIYKIFPFDSGAFSIDKYTPHLSSSDNIFNYEISKKQIKCYIKQFFLDNNNYLNGNVNKDLEIHSDLRSFYLLLLDRTASGFDTRCRTVEISTKQTLEKSSIIFIFLHIRLKTNTYVKKLLDNNQHIKAIYYTTLESAFEHDMYLLMIVKIKEYLMENMI